MRKIKIKLGRGKQMKIHGTIFACHFIFHLADQNIFRHF